MSSQVSNSAFQKSFEIDCDQFDVTQKWKTTEAQKNCKVQFQFQAKATPVNQSALPDNFDFELVLKIAKKSKESLSKNSKEEKKAEIRSQSAPLPTVSQSSLIVL